MKTLSYLFNSQPGEILWFPSLTSTNDTAKELAESGRAEGTCVIADQQTSGRGRQGRSWYSPAGEALYLSLVLKPSTAAEKLQLITLATAIAAAETAKQFLLNQAPNIKWPNDILINNRKVCGILVESSFEGGKVKYVILGIGFNLNQTQFPPGINDLATSLRIENGSEYDRQEFALALLDRIAHWYSIVQNDQTDAVINRWSELSNYANDKSVTIDLGHEQLSGITCGLSETGALRLKTKNGTVTTINAGEIVNLRS
ncbi:MAG TPA: biotin--[acetyl-CoA-carboxylase] ligase [Blastocatellia bacterium]|nr:biotin--[acetyl-CoA-carboxylase] ligase [Blastocatellia bacterium]